MDGNKKLNVLDLFSGIGGFSLGLERTGSYRTVAFCEIDEHCHKVLKKHWPTTPIFTDVSKLKWNLSEKVDVICGGFPCTDISVAGKQKGLNDEFGNATRSGLWFEYARLIGEIKPRYVIIENVAALRGNGLTRVLQDLWSIGYDAEWHIISARSIGACHLRERIWIIAYPSGELVRKQSISKRGRKGSAIIGDNGENGNTSDTHSNGHKKSLPLQSIDGRKDLFNGGVGKAKSHNADSLRLWKSFAAEESKSEWWTETTASQRDWWKAESAICRMDDAISDGLHEGERFRKQRIKQLGNSIVPGIAEIIGKAILEWEAR